MKHKNLMRILIIGNSGSGKTYTSEQLSHLKQLPCLHLDEIVFRPGGLTVDYECSQ
jgi:adenylate kinase family enzyme